MGQGDFLQTPEPSRCSDMSPREIAISHHFASHVNLISTLQTKPLIIATVYRSVPATAPAKNSPHVPFLCLSLASPSAQASLYLLRLAVIHHSRPTEKARSPTKSKGNMKCGAVGKEIEEIILRGTERPWHTRSKGLAQGNRSHV